MRVIHKLLDYKLFKSPFSHMNSFRDSGTLNRLLRLLSLLASRTRLVRLSSELTRSSFSIPYVAFVASLFNAASKVALPIDDVRLGSLYTAILGLCVFSDLWSSDELIEWVLGLGRKGVAGRGGVFVGWDVKQGLAVVSMRSGVFFDGIVGVVVGGNDGFGGACSVMAFVCTADFPRRVSSSSFCCPPGPVDLHISASNPSSFGTLLLLLATSVALTPSGLRDDGHLWRRVVTTSSLAIGDTGDVGVASSSSSSSSSPPLNCHFPVVSLKTRTSSRRCATPLLGCSCSSPSPSELVLYAFAYSESNEAIDVTGVNSSILTDSRHVTCFLMVGLPQVFVLGTTTI